MNDSTQDSSDGVTPIEGTPAQQTNSTSATTDSPSAITDSPSATTNLTQRDDLGVPRKLQVTASVVWRLLVVGLGIYVFALFLDRFSAITIPIAIALLFSALLLPGVNFLTKYHVNRGIAVATVMLGGLTIFWATLAFVAQQFIDGLPDLVQRFTDSLTDLRRALAEGPLHLDDKRLEEVAQRITRTVTEHQDQITSSAINGASALSEFVTSGLLLLFTLIFFLYDGPNIWKFMTRVIPVEYRAKVRNAGVLSFQSLTSYVRATFLVALVDAVGIGIGLAICGVPLALPLASLVFLAAFIPIVGSVLAGMVAVSLAFFANGWVTALIVFAIVIAVMQLESHVLQPLLLGRAVSLHALAVVLAIALGITVAGIAGGILAVPIVAVCNTAIRTLLTPNGATADLEEVLTYHSTKDDPGKKIKLGKTQEPGAVARVAHKPRPASTAAGTAKGAQDE